MPADRHEASQIELDLTDRQARGRRVNEILEPRLIALAQHARCGTHARLRRLALSTQLRVHGPWNFCVLLVAQASDLCGNPFAKVARNGCSEDLGPSRGRDFMYWSVPAGSFAPVQERPWQNPADRQGAVAGLCSNGAYALSGYFREKAGFPGVAAHREVRTCIERAKGTT
jgi:hypothetical protein